MNPSEYRLIELILTGEMMGATRSFGIGTFSGITFGCFDGFPISVGNVPMLAIFGVVGNFGKNSILRVCSKIENEYC